LRAVTNIAFLAYVRLAKIKYLARRRQAVSDMQAQIQTDALIEKLQECSAKLQLMHKTLLARQEQLAKQAELLVKWTEALKDKDALLNEKEKLLSVRE